MCVQYTNHVTLSAIMYFIFSSIASLPLCSLYFISLFSILPAHHLLPTLPSLLFTLSSLPLQLLHNVFQHSMTCRLPCCVWRNSGPYWEEHLWREVERILFVLPVSEQTPSCSSRKGRMRFVKLGLCVWEEEDEDWTRRTRLGRNESRVRNHSEE